MAPEKENRKNRLASSGSPYLKQHATNPVDWHPWSPEAFVEAAARDKPVFVSIGYSTCHWCHVMEKESFADEEVAALMNDAFVCVKVDREERPDIDHLYMTVCQLLTGSGGWPLTVIMTPDQKPFFAGTYFPRDGRYGQPGMIQIIARIRELWESQRETVESSAEEILNGLQVFLAPDAASAPDQNIPEKAFRLLLEQYDARYGGFGSAPKFPVFSNLLFLLRYWNRTGDDHALDMVRQTLDAMHRGGIYDQLGYGFHRYSTDERWFAPHFEKMLYDQALAVMTYAEAFAATGENRFRDAAAQILDYVMRDLTAPDGGFYSAEDADSEGEEGKFYTWTARELEEILDGEEFLAAREVYGVSEKGNFLSETGQPTGRNILYLKTGGEGLSAVSGTRGLDQFLEGIRTKLMKVRNERIRPLRDEKVMTDWNGLMIAALAKAAWILKDNSYTIAAERGFEAIAGSWIRNVDRKNILSHIRYRDGETIPAFLDDYAYLIWGALELYQVTHRTDYLSAAVKAAREMVELFEDPDNGGFFLTASDNNTLLTGQKPSFDGPMPSGNAVAAMALLRLGRLTASSEFEEKAHKTLQAFTADMRANPSGYTHMISALDMALNGTAEVIIVGDMEKMDTQDLLTALKESYLPNVLVGVQDPGRTEAVIKKLIPYASEMTLLDGKAAAYVCKDFSCKAPTSDPVVMLQSLREGKTA